MNTNTSTNTCSVTVFQSVDVAAEVRIRPHVTCGPAHVYCEESQVIACNEELSLREPCVTLPEDCENECAFWVVQRLCVAIPVHFDADAICTEKRIHCSHASTEPCPPEELTGHDGSPESGEDERSDSDSGHCSDDGSGDRSGEGSGDAESGGLDRSCGCGR